MAFVDCAIGIGWPIVKDIDRRALANLANLAVNSHLFPFFEPFGLVLRQVRLHGKISLRQIQGSLQIERLSHYFSQGMRLRFHYSVGAGARSSPDVSQTYECRNYGC